MLKLIVSCRVSIANCTRQARPSGSHADPTCVSFGFPLHGFSALTRIRGLWATFYEHTDLRTLQKTLFSGWGSSAPWQLKQSDLIQSSLGLVTTYPIWGLSNGLDFTRIKLCIHLALFTQWDASKLVVVPDTTDFIDLSQDSHWALGS